MEKAKGARGSGSNQHKLRSHDDTTPTLRALGVTKDQSSQWQKLAAERQETFDAALADTVVKPSTNGIIQASAPKRVGEPVAEDAPYGCIPLASHATAPVAANTMEPKIMRRIMA